MEKLYTLKETAEILRRTEKTVKKYIGRGLTTVDFGGGYLFPESSINDFIEKNKFPREN